MNVGEDKGKIVANLVKETHPQTMVELGGYCGYSTILFGAALRDAGGKRYYSLERSPKFAKNIEALVDFAGLGDIVEVVVGPSDEGIKKLHAAGKLKSIDMMFLDHYKPAYTTDLKLCEHLGLIGKGTVLAADNVISPGNPPYLEYVRSTVEEKKAKLSEERKADTDNFPGRSATQYGEVETLSREIKGNPHLIYKSELINSYEPTGIPVCFYVSWDSIMADECCRMVLKSRAVWERKRHRLTEIHTCLNQCIVRFATQRYFNSCPVSLQLSNLLVRPRVSSVHD